MTNPVEHTEKEAAEVLDANMHHLNKAIAKGDEWLSLMTMDRMPVTSEPPSSNTSEILTRVYEYRIKYVRRPVAASRSPYIVVSWYRAGKHTDLLVIPLPHLRKPGP